MTVQGDNCRYYNFPHSRPTYMCSVASKVELAFPLNGGVIQGVLNVELDWSKKTNQGSFKCEGNTEGNVDAMMWTDYRGPLSSAMGWPEKQLLPFVFCTNDNCFKQDLKISEPWHENKGCMPLDWPVGCDPSLGQRNPKLNCPVPVIPPGPPPPVRQNKALSIIFQHLTSSAIKMNDKSWLFFTGDYGKSSACRDMKEAIKRVPVLSGSVENPPWPGGTYTLNLFDLECDYKNNGNSAGALWCNEEQTSSSEIASGGAPPLAKTRRIPCKEELTRWSGKAEACGHSALLDIARYRVVTCDW